MKEQSEFRTEFEVRVLAQLVGTNPRRVEGWVEKGFLNPVVRGRGPGRRRVFDLANLLQAALLVELLSTFGERSRAVGRIVREVGRTLKDDTKRLLERLAELPGPGRAAGWEVDEATAVLGNSPEILWIELERKGGVRVRLLKPEQRREIPDVASSALLEGRTVVLLNITRILAKLGGRLVELRD